MASDVGRDLRHRVAVRARHACEYCRIREDDAGYRHQIDHVVSRKHGGKSTLNNLAYACVVCNSYKGTDVASLAKGAGHPVRLFNPRTDNWPEHFYLNGPVIKARTQSGEATIRLLRFNSRERVEERRLLLELGRYPAP